jgi:hypothetical protein
MGTSAGDRIRVGGHAKVISACDWRAGHVGMVHSLGDEDDEYDVYLYFDDDPEEASAYFFDEIRPVSKPVARAIKQQINHTNSENTGIDDKPYRGGADHHETRNARQRQGPEPFGFSQRNAVQRYFDGLSQRETVGAIVGAVATALVLLGLLVTLISSLSGSEVRDSCEAEASRNGYSGVKFEQVVDFCIEYHDMFGGQP